MTSTVIDFDLDDVQAEEPRSNDREPVPLGKYHVRVNAVEVRDTRAGGKMAVLDLRIVEGPHRGRAIFDRLNTHVAGADSDPQKKKAQDIARAALKNRLTALGHASSRDLADVVNCEAMADVEIEPPRGQYSAANKVRTMTPIGGAVATAPSTPAVAKGMPPKLKL